MRGLTAVCVIAASAVLCALDSRAQQAPPLGASQIDVSTLGPQVGERVPEFSLRDQNGRTQTLQSIVGRKGAMLVFVRSADW
jgi:hypothetical protein